jgi:hypothetical protein
MLRVVATDVEHGPCPIPYPRICTLCAQSRGAGSNKPPSSSQSSTAGVQVLLKASSSSSELHLEGVLRVLPWLHRGYEVLMPRVVCQVFFYMGCD